MLVKAHAPFLHPLRLWLDLCDNNGVGVFRCAGFAGALFDLYQKIKERRKTK